MAEHIQQEVCHHQRLAGAGRLCLRQAAAAEDPSLDQSVLQQEESGRPGRPDVLSRGRQTSAPLARGRLSSELKQVSEVLPAQ